MATNTSGVSPKDWSVAKKIFHTGIPCIMAFVITLGTSITVPATRNIMEEFNISQTVAILPLTCYTLGIAFGPLIFAPMSEVFGRLWLYRATFTCLLAFSAGAGGTKTYAGFLVCRTLAGLLGAPALAMGAGTIADLWHLGKAGGGAGVLFIFGPFLGPTLAPLISAYTLAGRNNDWRWTQWILCLIGAPIWISTWFMQETYVGRRSLPPGTPLSEKLKSLASIMRVATIKPLKMLVVEIPVLSLSLYTAYAYALIFSYFASSAYVLPREYGFDLKEVGLSFISVIIGFILAGVLFKICDKLFYRPALAESGGKLAPPEHRLYAAMIGSVCLPVALFWYAWEPHAGGEWSALVAAGIPLGIGALSLLLSSITYLVDVYQSGAAASALAANGILRFMFGALFPLFTQTMYRNLGIHWAGSVFAFLSLPMIPIPFLLYRYGHVLRRKSRFPASTASRARFPLGKRQSPAQTVEDNAASDANLTQVEDTNDLEKARKSPVTELSEKV